MNNRKRLIKTRMASEQSRSKSKPEIIAFLLLIGLGVLLASPIVGWFLPGEFFTWTRYIVAGLIVWASIVQLFPAVRQHYREKPNIHQQVEDELQRAQGITSYGHESDAQSGENTGREHGR